MVFELVQTGSEFARLAQKCFLRWALCVGCNKRIRASGERSVPCCLLGEQLHCPSTKRLAQGTLSGRWLKKFHGRVLSNSNTLCGLSRPALSTVPSGAPVRPAARRHVSTPAASWLLSGSRLGSWPSALPTAGAFWNDCLDRDHRPMRWARLLTRFHKAVAMLLGIRYSCPKVSQPPAARLVFVPQTQAATGKKQSTCFWGWRKGSCSERACGLLRELLQVFESRTGALL